MTDRDPHSTWPQIANITAFLGTLVLGGSLLLLAPPGGGEVSEDEHRALAPAPEFTPAGLADGSYTDALGDFVADHFPRRDWLMALHFWIKDHHGIHDERVALYDLVDAEGADLEGAGWDENTPPPDQWIDLLGASDAAADEQPDPPDMVLAATDLDGAPDEEAAGADPAHPRVRGIVQRGILVSEGRAMQLFTGRPKGSPAYARAINGYADALAGKVDLYVLIAPTAQAFYLPDEFARYSKSEPANIAATHALMRPSVKIVDAYAALAEHTDEYIYFRSDHHWTGRGAYYAYTAFCKAAGLQPVALAAMERRSLKQFHGSLFRLTRDAQLLASPDTVEYWVPNVETTTSRYAPNALKTPFKSKLLFERGAGYGVFLGGDAALMIVKTTQNVGRRALLLKNSYGNAFSIFLAAHYEELLIVDYRHFRGSLLGLIEEHAVTDLIILNGTITANAAYHIARVAYV
ncbi:MAG: hypothetical protein H0T76_19200, partial [Nannocystis sp.]